MLKLLKIVALSLTLATPAVAQQYTPIPPIRNFTPRHHHNPVADLERPECKDKPGLVKGQKGYAHCRDHHFPQQVFTTANCKCSVGECRETEWKTSLQSPTGTIFKYVDDAGKESWCPVDKFIDMKKIRVPAELTGEAYICVESGAVIQSDGCPRMEDMNCNLRRDGV